MKSKGTFAKVKGTLSRKGNHFLKEGLLYLSKLDKEEVKGHKKQKVQMGLTNGYISRKNRHTCERGRVRKAVLC